MVATIESILDCQNRKDRKKKIESIQNRPDGSGMVADWVGADPCVCPQRRPATIRTNSGTFRNDER